MALDASPLHLRIRQVLGGPAFPDAGPLHILVMLILVSYGEDGHDMRPSGNTLAYEASMSRRNLSRVLKDLEHWGLLKATEREGRRPVVWEIGESLRGDPAADHWLALDAKARVLQAREQDADKKPNPEKTIARAIKMFQKHKPPSLVRQCDELRAEIVVLPDESRRIADEILNDMRSEWPKEWERPLLIDEYLRPARYASFAAVHTREPEDL